MTPTIFIELDSADDAIACAQLLGKRGVQVVDAYTPYAVPELEAIVGTKRTRIPWASLAAGVCGATIAFSIIWYCNAHDYPLDVGARPTSSIPSDIPIMFETAVLFAALTTFFLLMLRMGLPRLAHPIFDIAGFDRVSTDRYWLGLGDLDDESSLTEIVSQLHARVIRRSERAS